MESEIEKYKKYFSVLFYLEEYSVNNIIKKIEQGFYYSKSSKQSWNYYTKKHAENKWSIFLSHTVASTWSTWVWSKVGREFLFFKTEKEAAEYFLDYVINETDFYDNGIFSYTNKVLIEKICTADGMATE